MNYVLFCKHFFGATNIPIFLLKNGHVEYSAMMETLPVTSQLSWRIYPTDHNPGFCGYSSDLEYGRVQIENTDYDLILGPAFSVPVTSRLVRQFMHELVIPSDAREIFTEFLCSIPRTSRSLTPYAGTSPTRASRCKNRSCYPTFLMVLVKLHNRMPASGSDRAAGLRPLLWIFTNQARSFPMIRSKTTFLITAKR